MENKMSECIATLELLEKKFNLMYEGLEEEYQLLLKEGYALPIRECIGKKLMLLKCICEVQSLKRKYWWN